MRYPILEFDPSRQAIIEPQKIIKSTDIPKYCILCFSQKTVRGIAKEKKAKKVYTLKSTAGNYPVYKTTCQRKKVAFVQPGVGGPLSGGFLEELIALGCKKFVACGGAGVLDKKIVCGELVLPISAIRDEGTSYHYLPAAREVRAPMRAIKTIEQTLVKHKVPFRKGKTWTTDAIFRETKSKVEKRKKEGCLTVEMEAASLFAIAKFRKVVLGQILYGGDDVSSEEWDARQEYDRKQIWQNIFWLAVEACLKL